MPIEDLNSFRSGFQMPSRLRADEETLTDSYGRFSAQPFERGLGITLGNSLRRALLTLIEGPAITAVKIEGVEHEFSTIKGVVEDATDIIMNLKRVPFILHGSEPKTLRISKDSAGEVTAADIQPDAEVEVPDPSVHIATVKEGGSLRIEMRLKRGRGYVSADRNLDNDLSWGYIPLDSVHAPVKKVNYTVEAARLGQDTGFDKLTIEVWTDGSVTPEDSIGLAAKVMKDHLSLFINFEEDIHDSAYSTIERAPSKHYDPFDRSVDELELSVRTYICLRNADLRTIRDLVQRSEREILATQKFGRKSLNEIKEILNGMGLDFGMEFDEDNNPIPGTGGRDAVNFSKLEDDPAGVAYVRMDPDPSVEVDLLDRQVLEDHTGPEQLHAALGELGQPLDFVREIIEEESVARRYVSTRYQTLINRKYLDGLSSADNDELDGLRATLDQMDEPYYRPILQRLQKLVARGSVKPELFGPVTRSEERSHLKTREAEVASENFLTAEDMDT